MEDAHITISDLGGGCAGVSLFGVFDGHGGREVAMFCEANVPDEVRRRLAPRKEDFASGAALTSSFHRIDELLRDPEHQQALLALKRGGVGDKGQGSSSSSSTVPEPGGEADGAADNAAGGQRNSKVLSFMQSSIKADLIKAKEKGSLSKDDATQLMMKMSLLKRVEGQQSAVLAGTPADTSAAANNVGCTAVCILLTEATVVCANAGDSRAVLCRGGRQVELSHDHKPNDDTERTRIEAVGGRVEEIPVGSGPTARVHYRVNGNLNLSRAIGDLEYKKNVELGHDKQMICSTPDIICMDLVPQDEFIVIACDGVWDVKSNQEACDFVRERLRRGVPIPTIIEELLDDCITKDPKETLGLGGDNMTAVVVNLRP